jgi:hypothetical protein
MTLEMAQKDLENARDRVIIAAKGSDQREARNDVGIAERGSGARLLRGSPRAI